MSSLLKDFEVVELYKDLPGLRIGVVHVPLVKSAFSTNIENVRHVIRFASKIGVKALILPPYMPHGMPTETIGDKVAITATSINKRNPYVKILKSLSRLHVLSIISPCVLERSRGSVYVSNIFVDGETGVARFFSRKFTLSEAEQVSGVRPGGKIDFVHDCSLRYATLLGEDVLVPEFGRLLALMGVDVIITFIREEVIKGLRRIELLKLLRVLAGIPIIHVGSVILDSPEGGVLYSSPTIAIVSNNEVLEYSEVEKGALITFPARILKESKATGNVGQLKPVLKVLTILTRYFKDNIAGGKAGKEQEASLR